MDRVRFPEEGKGDSARIGWWKGNESKREIRGRGAIDPRGSVAGAALLVWSGFVWTRGAGHGGRGLSIESIRGGRS